VRIGEPAVEPLIEMLGSKNRILRGEAARILGEIKDKRAVEPLVVALNDARPEVRIEAAQALGKISEPSAVLSLVDAMADPDANVRAAVEAVLVKMGKNPNSIGVMLRKLLGQYRGWQLKRKEQNEKKK